MGYPSLHAVPRHAAVTKRRRQGHLPYIHRMIGEMSNHTDGLLPDSGPSSRTATATWTGGEACRSLHAAFPVLILLFFWGGARWWWRILLVAYPLAMAFTLVYGGEHYVTDVLAGWIYAVVVYGAVLAIERALARRRGRTVPATPTTPAEAPIAGAAEAAG